MDEAIRNSGQDNWKANPMKTKRVLKAIRTVLEPALAARAATHLNATCNFKRRPIRPTATGVGPTDG